MMEQIVIAIGCNTEQETGLGKVRTMLHDTFPGIRFGTPRWTQPIGIKSDKFLNSIAVGQTDLPLHDVEHTLKTLEAGCGDSKELRARNVVMMDLDLLMYGKQRRHEHDWTRPYIQEMLAEAGMNIQQNNTNK